MGRTPQTRRDPYGAWLHYLRTEKGLTQDQIAEQIGVPQSTLAHWERSGKLPGRMVIIKLARILGVSIEELLRARKAGAWQEQEQEAKLALDSSSILRTPQ